MGIVFIILTTLTTVYLTFLTSKGGLTDNRYKSWLKKITKRGWIVFGVNAVVVGLLVVQYLYNEAQSDKKDKLLAKERDTRDSTITARIAFGVDSSRRVLYGDLSVAFAAQNLKFDSVRRTVERLQDSAMKPKKEADPTLLIPNDGIKIDAKTADNTHVTVTLLSRDAGSSDFKVTMYAYFTFEDIQPIKEVNRRLFSRTSVIPVDMGQDIGFTLPSAKLLSCHVYITGTYATISKQQHYNVDEVYVYDMQKNRTSFLIGEAKERFKKEIIEK